MTCHGNSQLSRTRILQGARFMTFAVPELVQESVQEIVPIATSYIRTCHGISQLYTVLCIHS